MKAKKETARSNSTPTSIELRKIGLFLSANQQCPVRSRYFNSKIVLCAQLWEYAAISFECD